jgi:hypothetical protein
MVMYRYGKPQKEKYYRAALISFFIVVVLMSLFYSFFISRSSGSEEINNNNTPLITKVDSRGNRTITINEPTFTLDLPGQWQETSRNPDPHYQSIQWNIISNKSVARWFRVYVDKIPKDFAVNYLLPISASKGGIMSGQQSDNCTTFTQGANSDISHDVATPISEQSLPAKWQHVNFLCDNTHVSHQVVGTGSIEGINTLAIDGPRHGKHNYFFVYEDDNYHADFSVLTTILNTFKAK